jgi:hypothetical protein
LKGPSCLHLHLHGQAVGLFDPEDEGIILHPVSHAITPFKT